MSDREKAIQLLNGIPDDKIAYIIGYIQGLAAELEVPNEETLKAFAEVDEMKRTGSGQHFTNLNDLWKSLED